MKIRLEDITPDLLQELEAKAEELRLKDMTLRSLNDLAQERAKLVAELDQVTTECQVRVLRAINLGFTKNELSKVFGVTVRQINKWVGNGE